MESSDAKVIVRPHKSDTVIGDHSTRGFLQYVTTQKEEACPEEASSNLQGLLETLIKQLVISLHTGLRGCGLGAPNLLKQSIWDKHVWYCVHKWASDI